MPSGKIKNLILLILSMCVVCLVLLVVPSAIARNQAEQALHEQLEQLFASYDIVLDSTILPKSVSLYAVELTAQDDQRLAAAAALLGEDTRLDEVSSRYAATYTGKGGSCTFSSDGDFSATLTSGRAQSDIASAARRQLRAMGFSAHQLSEVQRHSAGVYFVEATQQILGVPVLSDGLRLCYTNNILTEIDGVFLSGGRQLIRVSEEASISCADALVALLSSRDALGWVGSRIATVRQYYRYAETASSGIRLSPVWIIETDTGTFCVNALNYEVTPWAQNS